ncbi:AAA family ATPase [Pseudanabaena minima]|uniref:trifunctional serine/threonine-protein kinase/ATP-binding protein/sensor histidine kinase n=1 Tax=Pseudanabaena minima TaxID=890415 RepID=UPI003DA88719
MQTYPSQSSDRFPQIEGYSLNQQIYADNRILVYRGIRLGDGQPIVLKMLRSDRPSIHDLLRLRNHYTIAKKLDSSGIVQPIALEIYGNGYVLVMLDEGYVSLSDYITANPLNLKEVLAIAIQMAKILDELYHQRVIHKDIKPSNILIHPNTKDVKLTDFGLATLLTHETQTIASSNILEGTLAYIAPEQTGRMNRGIDYRTDFYALGVTLFELLTGQLPFRSNDSLELLHCHLAKPAPLACEFNSDIPVAIAQIVVKLMAKNTEDRYQSTLGLKYDLEIALDRLNDTGTITPFGIGEKDRSDRFTIPEKLYGREVEVQILLDAFSRVSQGSAEFLLVAGFSGIGKTAMVNEVHKPIVRQRGYFIKGKFDQFNRNIPFSAFVQAFRDLMGQLLSESDAQLAAWKIRILEELGDNGRVIIEVIPELELVIGSQPPVIELSGTAAQNRFNLLFQRFIQVFTTKDHPLVLFLDDLQWADLASLQLLQLLMQDTGHLLILGAYRDNEVSPVHPFILAVDEIAKAGAPVHTITLPPLREVDLNQLVADTLICDLSIARPLTELIYQKTKGNPFFATQFLKALYEESLITFNRDTQYWQWDFSQIAFAFSDDVVEFMATQLQKLPIETQDVLKVAACIGAQFDLQILAIASQQAPQNIAQTLWQALQEGFILPTTEAYKFFMQTDANAIAPTDANATYKFLHDRVQQAAYSLIPKEREAEIHLKIGKLIQQSYSKIELEERLFDLVGHLNQGQSLITEPIEREALAKLNLKAAKRARMSTAYAAAKIYLDKGIALLQEDSWQYQYELTVDLYLTSVEASYLSGDFAGMEQQADLVLQKAQTIFDKVKIYEIQISAKTLQSHVLVAIEIGRKALLLLGINLPNESNEVEVAQAMQTLAKQLENIQIADLVDLPSTNDVQTQLAMRIMGILFSPIIQGMPSLLPWLGATMVSLSIQSGNTAASAIGYAIHGLVMSAFLTETVIGYAFGKVALNLIEKFNSAEIKSVVMFLFGNFVQPHNEPLLATIPILKSAYNAGIEIGDFMHAGFSLATYSNSIFFSGGELELFVQDMATYSVKLAQIKQSSAQAYINLGKQTAENLIKPVNYPHILIGDTYNEAIMLPKQQLDNDQTAIAETYIYKLLLAYYFGNYTDAIHYVKQAEQCLIAVSGSFFVPIFHFFAALTHLRPFPEQMEAEQSKTLIMVQKHQDFLDKMSRNAPMNYLHKWHLVEAERYCVLGNKIEAIEYYDRAIAGAKENSYIQEEALANELAAKFYLDWGKEKIAQVYMTEAYYGYVRWGASAKVTDLENRYPQLLAPILRDSLGAFQKKTISPSGNTSEAIDLTTLLKASQAISEEIELSKLLEALLNIANTNSGADKCVLLLQSEPELQIVALVESGKPSQIFSSPISLEHSEDLAIGIVNQVKHSLEPIVLSDARQDAQFASDRYILKYRPKSVLCMPILKQGKLIGILYLENSLTIGAFTSDRLEVLNLICSQAAISLENAQLYRTLEQKVEERTQELSEALTNLQTTQSELIQSERMAALGQLTASVAHEVNTPLGVIRSATGNIITTLNVLLPQLPVLMQRLNPIQQDTFIALVNTSLQQQQSLSTKEERQLRRRLQTELEALGIAKPQEIANQFALLRIESSLEAYQHLLEAPDCDEILQVAYKLVQQNQNAISIQQEVDRAAKIVFALKTYSHRSSDAEEKSLIQISDGIEIALTLYQNRLKQGIEVIRKYEPVPDLLCNPDALTQVWVNLIDNAIYAIGKTGTLEIAITTQAGQIVVEITNSGEAIPDEIIPRLFEPFFTTKPRGEGSGLGLDIVRQIVLKHDGGIQVSSQSGRTTFSLYFPLPIDLKDRKEELL